MKVFFFSFNFDEYSLMIYQKTVMQYTFIKMYQHKRTQGCTDTHIYTNPISVKTLHDQRVFQTYLISLQTDRIRENDTMYNTPENKYNPYNFDHFK